MNDVSKRNQRLYASLNTFTKSARAKINAALISFPMRCHLAVCGTNKTRMQSKKRMKHIALGVNIGNLSRQKTRRELMSVRCDRINRYLARKNADLLVIGFYRHTGNLVLKTTTLQPAQAAEILSEADRGTWMAVSEATMRKRVREVRKLQAPEGERGVRWTPGLAFAVTKPRSGDITSSAKVRLHSIDLGTVAAWKRDSNHGTRTTR
jgi:hypothetical protein